MTTTDTFQTLPLAAIAPSLTNPRKTFNAERLAELANSIKASGVHQPILVRPLPGERVAETGRKVTHEIVAGERRYRASQLAGASTIPALVRPLSDEQVLEIQIVENLQRDDLTQLEEAEGYQQLMHHSALTSDQVGAKIGKSRSYVYARLKLLDLSTECKDALRAGTIDASRALLIARIPDTALQAKALVQASRKNYSGDVDGVRSFQSWLAQNVMLRLDTAHFKITDATLCPEAGSCKECPKRTGANPDLFSDVGAADVCTDPPCFHKKESAHTALQLSQAHERGQTVIAGREAKTLMPNSYGGIEGYLRLDDKRDSPTDKTLRKMLGKALDNSDVQPTLIANPHKEGELIAVLPAATVADLLKAKGHIDASKAVKKDITADKRIEAAQEQARLIEQYEQGWRNELLAQSYAAVVKANFGGATAFSDPMLRLIAQHYANMTNGDKAKAIGKLLGLGKVAPKEALLEHVKTCDRPEHVLLLLVGHNDVQWNSWQGEHTNPALLQLATDYKVNVDEVKAQVKKALTPTAPLAQPSTPPATAKPAAQTPVKTTKPKPAKLTAEEAQSGIAAAMQDAERAGTSPPEVLAGITDEGGHALMAGRKVQITSDAARLPPKNVKHAGKQGTITEKQGDTCWWVTFKGRTGGMGCFDASELKAVTGVAA